jgi:hypothetical protein
VPFALPGPLSAFRPPGSSRGAALSPRSPHFSADRPPRDGFSRPVTGFQAGLPERNGKPVERIWALAGVRRPGIIAPGRDGTVGNSIPRTTTAKRNSQLVARCLGAVAGCSLGDWRFRVVGHPRFHQTLCRSHSGHVVQLVGSSTHKAGRKPPFRRFAADLSGTRVGVFS